MHLLTPSAALVTGVNTGTTGGLAIDVPLGKCRILFYTYDQFAAGTANYLNLIIQDDTNFYAVARDTSRSGTTDANVKTMFDDPGGGTYDGNWC